VVRAIGYGDDENGQTPAKLKQAFLDIFDDNDCESTYNNIYFPDTNICAGTADGTRDVCPGDSGGPLLTTSNVQVGIVSFGYTESICGNSPPDGFTDVAAYSQWILNGICKYSDVPPANCPNQPKGAKGGRRLKPERTRKWRARN
jgi:trypsin